MDRRFFWQAPTELDFSPEYSGTRGLWTSGSCSNLLSDFDSLYNTSGESSNKNFIHNSPERQFYSSQSLCSDYQQNDFVASLSAKKTHQQGEPNRGVNNGGSEAFRSVMDGERSSTFVKWNGMTSFIPSLQTQKSQSLHKRCIRFLKCINDHRMSPLDETHGGKHVNKHDDYDKLAIHHVVAERKRREEMKHIFSALRLLLPTNPKKGRAPVLLQTIDYVTHLKQLVDQLERRNGQL